jgi:hypothetical protein
LRNIIRGSGMHFGIPRIPKCYTVGLDLAIANAWGLSLLVILFPGISSDPGVSSSPGIRMAQARDSAQARSDNVP